MTFEQAIQKFLEAEALYAAEPTGKNLSLQFRRHRRAAKIGEQTMTIRESLLAIKAALEESKRRS
jgi:hypothetical protein